MRIKKTPRIEKENYWNDWMGESWNLLLYAHPCAERHIYGLLAVLNTVDLDGDETAFPYDLKNVEIVRPESSRRSLRDIRVTVTRSIPVVHRSDQSTRAQYATTDNLVVGGSQNHVAHRRRDPDLTVHIVLLFALGTLQGNNYEPKYRSIY